MSQNFTIIASRIADVPCLTIAPSDKANCPIAFVLHGLTRSKESMLPTLYAMAREGLRAIAPDARLHGERPNAEQRDQRMQTDYFSAMEEIILGTAADLSAIMDALGIAEAGIHGVSLGGYIAFAALADEPRLHAASIAMGSPDLAAPLRQFGLGKGDALYDSISAISPLARAAATFPMRPLLMLHGDQDSTVPIDGVKELFQRLLPFYEQCQDRLQLIVYPTLDHVYTDEMDECSVAWQARYAK